MWTDEGLGKGEGEIASDFTDQDIALSRLLERLAADEGRHLVTGPADEVELRRLEQVLGYRLPRAFRTFLARFGGGIFYDRHEVFGPRQLQLHDIEFVPSLTTIQRRLGEAVPAGTLAFHRGAGLVHALDLRPGSEEPVAIRSLDGSASYPDLARFLESVILPASD